MTGKEAEPRGGERRWARHVAVASAAFLIGYAFYRSRMEWDAEMRTWRAVGDAAFVLLWAALLVGPLVQLRPQWSKLLTWRRQFGVWAALTASLHLFLVWDGWARWDTWRLFGYEDLPLSENTTASVVTDPGFGLANALGLAAFGFMLVTLAISSDRAMDRIGPSAWKRLQQGSHTAFYLVALHAAYFLFLHYEPSLKSLVFQKGTPPPNWFRWWFVIMAAALVAVQSTAFWRTVRRKRSRDEVKEG